jgi:prephenate dehydrogenase
MNRVAIFGLGLIGGSLALAIRKVMPDCVVVGVDFASTLHSAVAGSAAHELVDAADPAACRDSVAGSDLAVLCMPVRAIESSVVEVLELARTVTDCGSTKRTVVRAAAGSPRKERFVPGHPMAGAPDGGIELARSDLFDGRRWILCPDGAAADAVSDVESLVGSLGAHTVTMTPEQHDHAVALTSHAPQILASLLWTAAERKGALGAVGPGFESATRVAGGPERMWGDILETNADCIGEVLAILGTELVDLAERLRRTPPELEAVLAILAQARQRRSGFDP